MTILIGGDSVSYRGFSIRVETDHSPESPREWDNFGLIWTFDRNYISPDKPPRSDPWEALVDLYATVREDGYQHLCNAFCDARGWDENIDNVAFAVRSQPERFFAKLAKYVIILPVYVYDHGMRSYSTAPFSCPWDSGQCGWTFVTLAEVREEYGVKRVTKAIREKAENTLRLELEIYNQWQSGEVFGYIVEDDDGEELDSCWGFYGMDADMSGLLEQARSAIDYHVNAEAKDRANRIKTMIRNHVPLDIRQAELS